MIELDVYGHPKRLLNLMIYKLELLMSIINASIKSNPYYFTEHTLGVIDKGIKNGSFCIVETKVTDGYEWHSKRKD